MKKQTKRKIIAFIIIVITIRNTVFFVFSINILYRKRNYRINKFSSLYARKHYKTYFSPVPPPFTKFFHYLLPIYYLVLFLTRRPPLIYNTVLQVFRLVSAFSTNIATSAVYPQTTHPPYHYTLKYHIFFLSRLFYHIRKYDYVTFNTKPYFWLIPLTRNFLANYIILINIQIIPSLFRRIILFF